LKIVRRLAEELGGTAVRIDSRTWSLESMGRDALTVGARRGLLVAALREDVVRDVLAGQGEPWLPDEPGHYGLRFRSAPGHPSLLPGLDGNVVVWYDGDLQLRVQPPVQPEFTEVVE
jgi:hypothetical protein